MKEWVQVILVTLQSLTTLSRNPGFAGHGQANLERITEYLVLLTTLVEEGEDSYQELKELSEKVKGLVAEERGPTRDEIIELRTRSQSARDRLQRVKEELLAKSSSEDDNEDE